MRAHQIATLLAVTLAAGCMDEPARTAVPLVEPRTTAVDVLFVVDDSPGGGGPRQAALIQSFPQLLAGIDTVASGGLAADYHIGVITTDLGAGGYVDALCKPGGLGGALQPIGREAPLGCAGPVGARFLAYNQIDGTSNLPAGKSLAETFACMAAVGSDGCGFEQPLEAAHRALFGNVPENIGFRREGALLVVVFHVDEDDCSADATSDLFTGSTLPPPDGLGALSYRCTRFGVAFDGPNGPELMPYGSSGGPVRNPRPATAADGGKLIDLAKYTQAFNAPKTIVGSVAGPPTPVESIILGGTPFLAASCSETVAAAPAVRLNAVMQSIPETNRLTDSVCGDYTRFMQELAARIGRALNETPCFSGVVDDVAHPDCVVEDVVGGVATALPACAGDGTHSCWQLATRTASECAGVCAHQGDLAQRYAIEIVRRQPTPTGTLPRASCRLRAVPSPAPVCTNN